MAERSGPSALPALRPGRSAILVALALLSFASGPPTASAAAPAVGALWVSEVSARTALLHAEIDPGGKFSTYHFDYITRAAYDANLAASRDGFSGASRLPASGVGSVPGAAPVTVGPSLFGLAPGTTYRYRLLAANADGSDVSATHTFATYGAASFALPDGRGWEMVSPPDKNGGEVSPPGTVLGGAVLQAATEGSAVTYSSPTSFATGATGAPPASQYIARRVAGGWSSENITPGLFAGSYGADPGGVPYQLFSPDLARGLLLSGRPCRGEDTGCPVVNPPLGGTDAPAGYQNYYLRESAPAGFEALLGAGDLAGQEIDPVDFELSFAGSSLDLRSVVLSTCAALTANATDGCVADRANLYKWSAGSLSLLNILPAQSQGNPGAALAAQSGAVSSDGNRVYWADLATGNLFLRASSASTRIDDDAPGGGGASFQTAAADGARALYTKAGHLYRYDAATDTSVDLTAGGGVLGVLGSSADATRVYYLTAAGLFLHDGALTTRVADAADASNYPPATGTSRVSADGTRLVFVATSSLTGYDNTDLNTRVPDSQVYLYDATGSGTLTCVSCNPTHGRPIGPSTIPGAIANGTTPGSTHTYKPRVLSTDGRRVFFESDDALALADVNADSSTGAGITDVYQWEAQGTGSCASPGGCVALISSGRSDANATSSGFMEDGATFVDASADSSDAFFLTDVSLARVDPGAIDLYDARIGGGFPEPSEPFPCDGDSCQIVPSAPQNPTLTTVLSGPGNSLERYRRYGAKAKKKCSRAKRKKGKCAKKGNGAKKRSSGKRGARR